MAALPPEENKQQKCQGKEEIHRCKICGECFQSGPALGGHMRKHYKGEIVRKPKCKLLLPNMNLNKSPSKWEKGETSSKPQDYKGDQKKRKMPHNFDLNELASEWEEGETSSRPQHYKGDVKKFGKEPLDSQSSIVPAKVEQLPQDVQSSTNVPNREPLMLEGQPSTNVQNREPLPSDGQSSTNEENGELLPRNFDLNELPPECEEGETSSKPQQLEEREAEEEKKEEEISISDNFSCKKSRSC